MSKVETFYCDKCEHPHYKHGESGTMIRDCLWCGNNLSEQEEGNGKNRLGRNRK